MANAKLEPGKPDITLGRQSPEPQDHAAADEKDSGFDKHNPLAELGLKRPVKPKSGQMPRPQRGGGKEDD